MNDLTRRLSVFIRKVRLDFHTAIAELHSIWKTSDPAYEEYEADTESDGPEIENLAATIKGFYEASAANDAKKYALDHRRYRLEWKGYVVAKGTALFLLAYTVITFVIAVYSIKAARATKESADAAKEAATTAVSALNQSIAAFRIDERAWIEIEPIKPVFLAGAPPPFPEIWTCDIYPKNLGKTVATDISVKAIDAGGDERFESAGGPHRVQDEMMLGKLKYNTGKPVDIANSRVSKVLAPNARAVAPFQITCSPPTSLEGHSMRHYIVGRIDYCDQFRVKHWLKFCYFNSSPKGEVLPCQEGNDEDRNPEISTKPESSCEIP
jgi:hypothetical protein